MERNYCWGTILLRVFRGIINSLKKSMCKILLIKTKQNPYQCSADFTNKVTSRTGRCHGHGASSQAQHQPPTRVLGLAGGCGQGGWQEQGQGGSSSPLRGSSGGCDSLKCWDRSCGRRGLGRESSKDLGRAGPQPSHPHCSGDGTVSPRPPQGTQCGPRAATPWHSPMRSSQSPPTSCDHQPPLWCPAATSSSPPALHLLWPFHAALASSSKKEKS